MLTIDLAELRRKGNLLVEEGVPAGDSLWEGSDLRFGSTLVARLEAVATATGQVVVEGRLTGQLLQVCRRCLAEVSVELDEKVHWIYGPSDELGDDDDDEFRELPTGVSELSFAEAVREETILSAPLYVVCREDCQGLCSRCGADLNRNDCGCTLEEPDPRWAPLRAMQNEE